MDGSTHPPGDRSAELGTKYADQIHVNPLTAFWYLPMDTNLAPFNNAEGTSGGELGRCIERLRSKIFGGRMSRLPVLQVLPPGFPGYRPYCPYTNPAGATLVGALTWRRRRSSVQQSGTAGQKVVSSLTSDDEVNKAIGGLPPSTLDPDRLQATRQADLREHPCSPTCRTLRIRCRSASSRGTRTTQPRPTSSTCSSAAIVYPGLSDSSINISGFCNKGFQAQDGHGARSRSSDETAAERQWVAIDRTGDRPVSRGSTLHPEAHRLRLQAGRATSRSASGSVAR